jgi:hypothetical protein
MPTTSPVSRDPVVEAHVFWHKFKGEIVAAIILVVLLIIGFAGYRFYSERQESAASVMLGSAKTAHDYEEVIARYPNTAAGASAYLLLAQAQRKDRKFAESNATLQVFATKNPKHELASSAKMAMAANLESMGKTDEALAMYQQAAEMDSAKEEESFIEKIKNLFGKQTPSQKSFNAPLALISEVRLLKAKNQPDAARHVCETIINQYSTSFWASEAARELASLKPSAPSRPTGAPATPGVAPAAPPASVRPPMALPGAPPKPTAAPTAKAKP